MNYWNNRIGAHGGAEPSEFSDPIPAGSMVKTMCNVWDGEDYQRMEFEYRTPIELTVENATHTMESLINALIVPAGCRTSSGIGLDAVLNETVGVYRLCMGS